MQFILHPKISKIEDADFKEGMEIKPPINTQLKPIEHRQRWKWHDTKQDEKHSLERNSPELKPDET